MLKVENISTGYGKKQVLFEISFDVREGEIVLLAGSNGSGKSTLLKAIYGMLPQWGNGQIILGKENITGKETSILLKKGLLYLPQRNNLFDDLTVKENLQMAGLTLHSKILSTRIEEVLSIFTMLAPYLEKTPVKISGGQRRLLTMAMAMLHHPKMILCDEPFAGVSPQNIDFIIDNLKQLNEKNGVSFLIVEHHIKECIKIADKIICLKLGSVFKEIELKANFEINELNSVFV